MSVLLILTGTFFATYFGAQILGFEDYLVKGSFYETYTFQRNLSRLTNNVAEKYVANIDNDNRLEMIDANLGKASSFEYIVVDQAGEKVARSHEDLDIDTLKTRQTAILWRKSETHFYYDTVMKNTSLFGYNHDDWQTENNVTYTKDILNASGYEIYTAISPNILKDDDPFFSSPYKEFRYFKHNQTAFLVNIILGILAILIGFIHLTIVTGRWRPEERVRIAWIDKVPFELVTIIWLATSTIMIPPLQYFDKTQELSFVALSAAAAIFALISVLYYQTFLRRVKSKTFLKSSIFGWLILKFFGMFKIIYVRKAFKPVSVIILFLIILVDLVLLFMLGYSSLGFAALILLIGFNAAVAFYYLRHLHSLYVLMEATKERAGGNINYPLDSSDITKPFEAFASDLNTLQSGVQIALNDAIKGEKMKTELITNVTHDLKNPLTSIINYIDLLKKEPIESEKSQDYIQIIDEKSKRLKVLIDDLVDASKVTTGNIIVKRQELDLIQLTQQVVGEFSEQFEEKALSLVFNHPEGLMPVTSDSGLVYRIMENLMGNITKYAMPTTRVYMDLYEIENEKVIEIKNVSQQPLNLTASELTERFVRGDESRNTEGSGLGLSIATSLAELIKSDLHISIDGDLFKSRLVIRDM